MDTNDPLVPELPDSLAELSDEDLDTLLQEHEVALAKIDEEDPEYVGGFEPSEVIAALELALDQITKIKEEKVLRAEAAEAYTAKKAELLSKARESETLAEGEGEEESAESEEAAEEEAEDTTEETTEEEVVAEVLAEEEVAEALTADAAKPRPVNYRRPPVPTVAKERSPSSDSGRTVLVAAAAEGVREGVELDRIGLANAMLDNIKRKSKPRKHKDGIEERTLIATAHYSYPPEMILRPNDLSGNNAKIRAIGSPFLGGDSMKAMIASGGFCAPLTPFYDIPDFAVTDRPVRDALPSFQAERGGVQVPSVSTIGSITTGVGVVEAADDAAGGSLATKSCQDMDCPEWTDVAVGAIYHCREYGNFNTRAWPEGIAHENNLTMAAHSRVADGRLLDRIKALSVNVTDAQTYNAIQELLYTVTRAAAGVRYRLRLNASQVMFRALMPAWIPDLLIGDVAATQFDRFKSRQQVIDILGLGGVSPVFYLDSPSTGTPQGFSDQSPGTLDDFPSEAQWALYLEGAFLHLDSGVLELGVVRDSSLNSTNDYQVFGETFENVARIGPEQAALWVTSTICPTGEFPELATALTC